MPAFCSRIETGNTSARSFQRIGHRSAALYRNLTLSRIAPHQDRHIHILEVSVHDNTSSDSASVRSFDNLPIFPAPCMMSTSPFSKNLAKLAGN